LVRPTAEQPRFQEFFSQSKHWINPALREKAAFFLSTGTWAIDPDDSLR